MSFIIWFSPVAGDQRGGAVVAGRAAAAATVGAAHAAALQPQNYVSLCFSSIFPHRPKKIKPMKKKIEIRQSTTKRKPDNKKKRLRPAGQHTHTHTHTHTKSNKKNKRKTIGGSSPTNPVAGLFVTSRINAVKPSKTR